MYKYTCSINHHTIPRHTIYSTHHSPHIIRHQLTPYTIHYTSHAVFHASCTIHYTPYTILHYNRLTYASSLSHLRRCNAPFPKEGKLAKPRMLHCTHWGMVCPAETPEGHAVGLVKNLSLMSHISVGVPVGSVIDYLDTWGMEPLAYASPKSISKTTKIFVNGNWIGVHNDPDTLVSNLVSIRRGCFVDPEVSIVRDVKGKEVRIYTDVGRICRPLFVVKDDQKLAIKKSHINQ
ncbi:hypothetical protein EON64_20225, partial [archaeon]